MNLKISIKKYHTIGQTKVWNSDEINKRYFQIIDKKQHIADKMRVRDRFLSNRIILTKIPGFLAEKYEK